MSAKKITLGKIALIKMGHPRSLFRLFSVFLKKATQILQQINVKNVHPVAGARIRTHDLPLCVSYNC